MVANLFHQGKIFLHSYEKSQDEKAVCTCHECADCSDIPKPIFVQKELPKTFFIQPPCKLSLCLAKGSFPIIWEKKIPVLIYHSSRLTHRQSSSYFPLDSLFEGGVHLT